ncbi:hypothetical protein [Alicyclobacillus fastidiosus]|uniref:Uncharacterized protein n=1 Tax=Alicyclobacillus fastidiosus TaxID=392011 RepID=A0ABV5AIK0_9BACL|nr:hypothetical protein [Alicyclobacillus fastidiosus]WEH07854.1 hypothetical protein PYS47_13910 [Alicyclobacillus fastidiosus]
MRAEDGQSRSLDTRTKVGATVFGLIAALILCAYLYRFLVQHWL